MHTSAVLSTLTNEEKEEHHHPWTASHLEWVTVILHAAANGAGGGCGWVAILPVTLRA
jgi:hypothetical protein